MCADILDRLVHMSSWLLKDVRAFWLSQQPCSALQLSERITHRKVVVNHLQPGGVAVNSVRTHLAARPHHTVPAEHLRWCTRTKSNGRREWMGTSVREEVLLHRRFGQLRPGWMAANDLRTPCQQKCIPTVLYPHLLWRGHGVKQEIPTLFSQKRPACIKAKFATKQVSLCYICSSNILDCSHHKGFGGTPRHSY